MPAYIAYRALSMTGTSFTERDMPERMEYIGAMEAVNSTAVREEFVAEGNDPRTLVVFRANTIEHHALNPKE